MGRRCSLKIVPIGDVTEPQVEASKIQSAPSSLGVPAGVRLAFLKGLARKEAYKNLTLQKLCGAFSAEEEKNGTLEDCMQSSVADIFLRRYSTKPHSGTGLTYAACFEKSPTHFVSYPKDCTLSQLVAFLEQYQQQEYNPHFSILMSPSPSFYLLDFSCPPGITLADYLFSVRGTIENSKVFLLILPDILTSSTLYDTMCLYRLSIVSRVESIDFHILFPSDQTDAFNHLLRTNIDELNNTFFAIDVDTSLAKSSEESQDKEAIIQYLVSSPPFYLFNITKSNASILRLIRKWLAIYITNHLSIFSTKLLSASSEKELMTVLKVGYLLYEYESYLAAKQIFLLLYSIYMAKYGPLHVNTLGISNNLVYTFEALQLPSQALTMARSVVEGYTSSSGPDHANTLAALTVCGALQRKLGLFSEGEKTYRTLLLQLEAQRGSVHPTVLQAMLHLAMTLQGQGKVVESQVYHQWALEGCILKLGVKHEITREVAFSFGLLLREMNGDSKKAEELIDMAQEGVIVFSRKQWASKQPAADTVWNRRRKPMFTRHASILYSKTLQNISSCAIS